METPFNYPTDRSELFGETNEEEASVYFRLIDFQDLIKKYGIDFIMNRLDNDTFINLASWFLDDDEDPYEWRNDYE